MNWWQAFPAIAVAALLMFLPGFVLATVVWSLGDLVLLGRAYSVFADLAPSGARGGHLAAYGVSWGVAAVLAPLVGTRLLAAGGPPLAWSVLAGACAVLAVAQPAVRLACCARGDRR